MKMRQSERIMKTSSTNRFSNKQTLPKTYQRSTGFLQRGATKSLGKSKQQRATSRSNQDIHHEINDSRSIGSLEKINRSAEHMSHSRIFNNSNISAVEQIKPKYFADLCKSIEKPPNPLELSGIEVGNSAVKRDITPVKNAISAIHEEEMMNCMKLAKDKVQTLANKLKLAKAQIVKLRDEGHKKDELIEQYQQLNSNLLYRISVLEQEVNSFGQLDKI